VLATGAVASADIYQYTDASGFAAYNQSWTGAQAITDTNAYPSDSTPGRSDCPNSSQASLGTDVPESNCLTDAQIQTELEKFTKRMPHDLMHEYFLITPPQVESCSTNDPNSVPAYGGCSAGALPANLG